MRVYFSVTFLGGKGQVDIEVNKGGKKIAELFWDHTIPERRWLELADGLYTMSVTGVAPPDGVDLVIFAPTKPVTPLAIAKGPIARIMTMKIKTTV